MTDEAPLSFGSLLRRLRLAAGLTQEELAERAQLSDRAIRRLESDPERTPRLQTVRLLAEALGLSDDDRSRLLDAARRADTDKRAPRRAPAVPRVLTPMLGREGDVAILKILLDERRLVTVSGMGGVGKTRLALALAEQVAVSFDRVLFVELAVLRDPAYVMNAIAAFLSIREDGVRSLSDLVTADLRAGRVLLLLDNMEHLLPAHGMVLSLLDACPELRILITSREALHVRGERVYTLGPLSLPERDADIPRSPAVRLFLDRAREAGARIASDELSNGVIAEICRRLEGLPLAIELAAAWTPVMSPAALLTHLTSRLPILDRGSRDLPARQRTMRDTIAWSYNLLSPEEQVLFARLSVFAGGCTLEAAKAVCDPDGSLNLLNCLARLVNHSLVHAESGPDQRFLMLETLREYAAERLLAAGEAERLRAAHAWHFLRMAEMAAQELSGHGQFGWLARLDSDLENVRVALTWFVESDRHEESMVLAVALKEYWSTHGYWSEAVRWLAPSLETRHGITPHTRARALLSLGNALVWLGRQDQALEAMAEAQPLFEELGDREGTASIRLNLGVIALHQGDYERAQERVEQALAAYRELEDALHVASSLGMLGGIALDIGDYGTATERYEEALSAVRPLGQQKLISSLVHDTGLIALREGRLEEAEERFMDAEAQAEAAGSAWLLAAALQSLGEVALRRGLYDEARDRLHESLQRSRDTSDVPLTVGLLESTVRLALATGRHSDAARLAGAEAALRQAARIAVVPSARDDYENVQQAVGSDTLRRERERGQAMSLEQAVSFALTLTS